MWRVSIRGDESDGGVRSVVKSFAGFFFLSPLLTSGQKTKKSTPQASQRAEERGGFETENIPRTYVYVTRAVFRQAVK